MALMRSAVEDRQAITEMLYRYCRAMDRMDVPLGYSICMKAAKPIMARRFIVELARVLLISPRGRTPRCWHIRIRLA